MRKFILGFLIGIAIMLPVHAIADSMVGKRVNTVVPIKLDGEYLDVEAIGIEGTTYAPVRNFAERLGKEVDWDEVNGEVNINTPKKSDNVYDEIDIDGLLNTIPQQEEKQSIFEGLDREELERQLKSTESRIILRQRAYEIEKNRYEKDPTDQNAIYVEAAKKDLEFEKNRLLEIQAAIDALDEQTE